MISYIQDVSPPLHTYVVLDSCYEKHQPTMRVVEQLIDII